MREELKNQVTIQTSGRREFLKTSGLALLSLAFGQQNAQSAGNPSDPAHRSFFFTSLGTWLTGQGSALGLMNANGTGLRYPKFDVSNQASWAPYAFFADGRRVILVSMEKANPHGKPFSKWYFKVQTHIWIYDMHSGSLTEIAKKERIAPMCFPCALLPDEERMIVQVVFPDGRGCLYNMDLDGSHQKQVTRPEEGFPYGVSLSPDGKRIAFHNSGPPPYSYRVFDCNTDGSDRVLVAGHPDHVYFGTNWSPDGDWILYEDCHYKTDPGHDWSDICIGRPDGSENRVLTQGQSQWFAASYGNARHHGDGSNVPEWCPDGLILYIHKLPGSRVAWQYQTKRPDTNHFGKDYHPEEARGGTEICLLNPKDGSFKRLTHNNPPQWDFRPTCSPDNKQILFCRARTGELPAIWVMDHDGTQQKLLTRGLGGQGADQPRWVPSRMSS